MFSGEISNNGNDGWHPVTTSSLEALQTEHPQSWARKGDRVKKIRKLNPTSFPQFFTDTTLPGTSPAGPASIQPPKPEGEAPLPPVVETKPNKGPAHPAAASPKEDQAKAAQTMLEGFQKSLQKMSEDIGAALTRTVKADLAAALDSNSARVQAALAELARAIHSTNFESQARALAEQFLADLRAKTDGLLREVEKTAGKTQASADGARDDLEKLRSDLEQRLKALRNLQGDLNEDTADLLDRIKKFGLGRVEVLEQQNEQLRKELEQSRSEHVRLHSELTQEKLARGAYDPALFQRVLKENNELSTAKVELERIRLQLANADTELADLRPLRTAKLEAAQHTKELSDLKDWKRKFQPELDREKDRAKVIGEEYRRLENEHKTAKRTLRDLEEDRRTIQDLKETSESYRNKGGTLETRVKKLEASEAQAQEKAAKLAEEVAQGREAYKREVETEHSRQLLLMQQRHGRELDNYLAELERSASEITVWKDRAEALNAKLQAIEEEAALGLRKLYENLLREHRALLADNQTRTTDIASAEAQRMQLAAQVTELRGEHDTLQNNKASLEGELSALQNQLDRHLGQQRQLEARKAEQKTRVFQPVFDRQDAAPAVGEWEWLQHIKSAIKTAGFRFNARLVNAFHTALKAQDISPLTLLAGISGTGKSELPRLYADAGGISFLPVAVQPNWDSPADLFGFYNYTEGVFHSTPLCRALRQFTNADHQPGMTDRVLMVLLDEMNLARVEYYFSDLLSRLEIRRGILRHEHEPSDEEWRRASVELNLGEGSSEWLRLGPNVLFVGTLNQDESTLDLSPKVVDRANTITFPRPAQFVDLTSSSGAAVVARQQLAKERWNEWCVAGPDRKAKVEQELKKKFDTVSLALEKMGRGVGQRVFQAAMRYVALYPPDPKRKRDGIQEAIEDQFAMKLIPKLKGIDTQSKRGQECLALFEEAVPEKLHKAFDIAKSDDIFDWRGADHMFAVDDED